MNVITKTVDRECQGCMLSGAHSSIDQRKHRGIPNKKWNHDCTRNQA